MEPFPCDLKFTQLLLVRIEVRARDGILMSLKVSLQDRVLLQGQREHFRCCDVDAVSISVSRFNTDQPVARVNNMHYDNLASLSPMTGNRSPFVFICASD